MNYWHDKPIRVLRHDLDGPFSMALDAALLQGIRNDPTLAPVFRLHRFTKPMLSIGNDKVRLFRDLDYDKLIADDVDVTVRPSAGSASYNYDQEVCFTFITRKEHWERFGIYDMYEAVNRMLCEAMSLMGVHTELVIDRTPKARRVADNLEILISGKKLVGSGLFTKVSVYSQEGVIPLNNDFLKVSDYFLDGSDYKNEVFCMRDGTPTSLLEQGLEIEYDLFAGFLMDTLMATWPAELGDFTAEEVQLARKIESTSLTSAQGWRDKTWPAS